MRFLLTKRFWIRLAIGLAIMVAVGLIFNSVMAWRMESRLQARLAAIRAAGDPASVADLAPEPIPDEKNAAAVLERIGPRLDAFSREYAQFYDSPLGKKFEEAEDRDERLTKAQSDALRVILDKYGDVERGLAAAANCDKYASRLDFSLPASKFIEKMMDTQGRIRTGARFLNWRIQVLLAEGQNEKAVECGIETYRLARLYESEPSMVAFLVAIAVRGLTANQIYDALAAGPVSPQVRAALEEELAWMEDPQRLLRTFKTERAISAGWDDLSPILPSLALARPFGWVLKSYQLGAIDFSDEYIQMATRPWHQVSAKLGPEDAPHSTGHGILADLLTPALRAVFSANARSLALARALRIDMALRQFAETNGREASGLEELNLPAEVTTDPFSGKPLNLKHFEDGWVIYTVMENGVDDGGDFKGRKDYGLAPPKRRLTE